MELFLKLPDELLVLIIKYINDNSQIEELITIPILQKYALQARYFKFQLVYCMTIPPDGSLKDLKALYEVYNFKPSKIIVEANKLYELLMSDDEFPDSEDELAFEIENMNQYCHAEFEILVTDRMNVQLDLILKKLNVVGIHLSKDDPLAPMIDCGIDAFQAYLQAIQFSNIKILSTVYDYNFVDNFPVSLKKLTIDIDCEDKFDMDFIELQCLEYFECLNLLGVESLEDIQLSRTVKTIKLSWCEFKTLGNLKIYNVLKYIEIFECENLFEIIKCSFPQSLETLVLNICYSRDEITELYDSVKQGSTNEFELSDFTRDGESFLFGSNFKLPSNTKILKINGSYMIELESDLCFKFLNTLELSDIKNIDLCHLFTSLPKNMLKLKIEFCELLEVNKSLNFPNIQHFDFSCNILSNIFQINLKQLRNLNHFDVTWNALVAPDIKDERLDPSCFLLDEINVFEGTSEYSNKKRKVFEVTKILQIDISTITHLNLGKSSYRIPEVPIVINSNNTIQLPSQICIRGCTTLKDLTLSGLSIKEIDLNNFPCSLQS
ncbi:uncharacterized protein KGF55_003185 [Candida pseudojiufengensis]|uniref:uncharacterized protein n=1 Tax=Candida pseudojiufengensis TaxID=497109 RepID=UPI002224AAF7|nr:uncharacterized protein KGF55_003185 [Candida pseudojiufengensis]KAI5962109.1 hypothetical protein KGF55_003185 [Candida pseudojiufengensis]